MRFGPGPVFAYERLVNARRRRTYAARSLIVVALLFGMATIASQYAGLNLGSSAQRYAQLGEHYFNALIGVELAFVMLMAPAATAGAICLDRARGTLAHVMATDLSDSEIVLGKLAARLLPVLALVACTWPVMAISTLLGGIDPTALTLAFAIIVAVAVLGCTIALALSVWAKKPHEVILATYVFWLGALMAWPVWYALSRGGTILPALGRWSLGINPFYLAFAPYAAPGRVGFWDYARFFTGAILTSGALVLLAVRRLRPVTTRQASEPGKEPRVGLIGRMGRWLPGPSLDGNPVLWREWHRSRPSRWMTILVSFLGGTTGLACCIGAFSIWRDGVVGFGMPMPAQLAGVFGYLIQLILGLSMLSVLAPLSLSEERQRGSLDVLIATPLSTGAIVLGKWWGTFRLVPMLAIGPGLMAFALATARRIAPLPVGRSKDISSGYLIFGAALVVVTVLAHGAAMTSIGLALATWIKRQVHAIAASVCVFVLVAVAWPIFVSSTFRNSQGLSFLSPIVVAGAMSDELSMRMERLPHLLWCIGFWDVGVIAVAIGIIWLMWRTFDIGLGRIPETVRSTAVMIDVIAALGGAMAASSLYLAISIWFQGFGPPSLNSATDTGAACFLLFTVFGLSLLAVVATLSISAKSGRVLRDPSVALPRSARLIVVTEWWRLFRLLALLSCGPCLIALVLALAPMENLTVRSAYSSPQPRVGLVARPVAPNRAVVVNQLDRLGPHLGARLCTVAVLITAIFGFGASTVGAGLALGASAKSRRWAIVESIVLFLFVAIAWPLLFPWQLFHQLVWRESHGWLSAAEWFAGSFPLLACIPLVILLLWLSIRGFERRSRNQHEVRLIKEPVP